MWQEEVVFPFLNTKMDFSKEIEQHQTIHATIEKLIGIIDKAKANPSSWDPAEMKELIILPKDAAAREPTLHFLYSVVVSSD